MKYRTVLFVSIHAALHAHEIGLESDPDYLHPHIMRVWFAATGP